MKAVQLGIPQEQVTVRPKASSIREAPWTVEAIASGTVMTFVKHIEKRVAELNETVPVLHVTWAPVGPRSVGLEPVLWSSLDCDCEEPHLIFSVGLTNGDLLEILVPEAVPSEAYRLLEPLMFVTSFGSGACVSSKDPVEDPIHRCAKREWEQAIEKTNVLLSDGHDAKPVTMAEVHRCTQKLALSHEEAASPRRSSSRAPPTAEYQGTATDSRLWPLIDPTTTLPPWFDVSAMAEFPRKSKRTGK